MHPSRFRRLEASIPATSGAGILLYCAVTMLPLMLIALTMRVLA